MKTAAIIGANSMLGRQLSSDLKSMGVNVITVGRYPSADIHLDLQSGFQSKLPENLHADTIFNCAASFADNSPDGLHTNYMINAAGSLWILDLARHLDCSFLIYAGTVFSYDTLESGGKNSYGFSKEQAENLFDWGLKNLNKSFCSLRLSQLYDTDGLCIHHQPWFGRIIAYAARGLDIRMPPSEGFRNFLHVEDASRMMIKAVEMSVTGIHPVVHPISITFEEIAHLAYSIFNQGGSIIIDPKKKPFRPMFFPDASNTYELLDLSPSISLDAGIARIRDFKTWASFGPLDVN